MLTNRRTEICLKPSERAFSLVYETHSIVRIPKIQSKKRAVTEIKKKIYGDGPSFTNRRSIQF